MRVDEGQGQGSKMRQIDTREREGEPERCQEETEKPETTETTEEGEEAKPSCCKGAREGGAERAGLPR